MHNGFHGAAKRSYLINKISMLKAAKKIGGKKERLR